MWKIAIAAALGCSPALAAPDFGKMRVGELRAYLSARHMDCFGCTEKHELVSKAREACEASAGASSCRAEPRVNTKPLPKANKKSTKPKPEAKAGGAARGQARRASQQAPGDQVLGFTLLFGIFAVGLWHCVRCVRQVWLQLWNRKSQCVFTMEGIRYPYQLPCCRHVCEQRAMGKWMVSSKYFRKRTDGQLERVAACPLCRKMLEPTHVRSLLNELRMAAPIVGDFAFDSGIPDPAHPVAAMHPNFILLKTRDELDQEIQQQVAPCTRDEACDEAPGARDEARAPADFTLQECVDESCSNALGLESDHAHEPGFSAFPCVPAGFTVEDCVDESRSNALGLESDHAHEPDFSGFPCAPACFTLQECVTHTVDESRSDALGLESDHEPEFSGFRRGFLL